VIFMEPGGIATISHRTNEHGIFLLPATEFLLNIVPAMAGLPCTATKNQQVHFVWYQSPFRGLVFSCVALVLFSQYSASTTCPLNDDSSGYSSSERTSLGLPNSF
jgi:hypothetical protein